MSDEEYSGDYTSCSDDEDNSEMSSREEAAAKAADGNNLDTLEAAWRNRLGKKREAVSKATELRRSRNLMGRVDDLWLKADDLKFDTESDISDVSEIWSEYGDKVCPSSQPKMVRWNQGRKKKDAKKKKTKRGKSRISTSEESQRQEFTSHFKKCLASAREDVSKKRKDALIARFGGTSTSLAKLTSPAARRRQAIRASKSPSGSRAASPHMMKAATIKSQNNLKSKGSTTLSFGLLAGMAFGKMASKGHPESALHAGAKSATSSHGDKAHAEKEAAGGGGGLGPRWPKGLWDNSDGHWRMIMAPAGGFSVTPGHYNAQYEYEFRQKKERVSYAEVEANRRRIKRWLTDPNASFTQPS